MIRIELVNYLDQYLNIHEVADYGPQGLQVETGNELVSRIALAVDVSPEIIETAASWQADMLLVHHGLFWGAAEPIAGPFGARVRLLMQHGINLYAAHLALDAHPEVGNNAILAKQLGVDVVDWWSPVKGTPIAVKGQMRTPVARTEFCDRIAQTLQIKPRLLPYGPETVNQVAILSGSGADKVADVHAMGGDTYLTGETSHAHYWAAQDFGINVIFAGHYATETVGVQALGQHLQARFGVEVRFFDFPTDM